MAKKKASRKARPVTRLPRAKLTTLERLLAAAVRDHRAESKLEFALFDLMSPDEMLADPRTPSVPRRRFAACWAMEGEVNNGGFMQFFDNMGPDAVREALAFLEERGPRKVTSLLRSAIAALPSGRLPKTRDKLADITLADFSDDGEPGPIGRKLEKITDRFFKGQFAHDLTRARLEYVREHAAEFFAA